MNVHTHSTHALSNIGSHVHTHTHTPKLDMVEHAFNPSTREAVQEDLCEFVTRLPYISSSSHIMRTYFKNKRKGKFLVSLETQLCHVIFFWKLSYERLFC